ncbi:hypothetical protein LXT21_35055 [Myxococcus sp. K38C18041901]|uniref:hypothetical protein n=1 Tax=Myxococcus guangdongensis TaxID=2906760 RepID=UPI0020A73828|nr:hypothetical protein [Myxococcus guangdongensis]MCP3064008.1 hypothetical protein [Myxococcus guangdongensis]
MSYRPPRGLLDLVLHPLRSLPLSVLALGGLLLAPMAHAADPDPDPQAEKGAQATITGLSLVGEGLKVRIQWAEKAELPSDLVLTSYGYKDEPTDSVGVHPEPGKETEVELHGASKEFWKEGWSQRLVLADKDGGEPILTQPFNFNLECPDDKECQVTVAPGVGTDGDVLHVSEELDAALTQIAEKSGEGKEVDLLDEVVAINPHLRGQAVAYSLALSKLQVQGPCTCVWQAVYSQNPSGSGYSVYINNAGGIVSGTNGPGAKHALTALGRNGISHAFNGISQVNLRLNCSRWVITYYIEWVVTWPGGPRFGILVPRLSIVPCTSTCRVRFDHQGRISGSTFAAYTSPGAATAYEQDSYRVDGTFLLNTAASNGGFFNQISGTSVASNVGSIGRVDAYGYVYAYSPAFPYFASASVSNGYSIAIHGQSSCPYGPYGHAAVWTYGTSQGTPQTTSLRNSIRNFFLNWGIWTNP